MLPWTFLGFAGIDRDNSTALVSSFSLFTRLIDSPAHANRVFGDISAVSQANRIDVLASIIERRDWHPRLLNGSDYPLPGILPHISPNLLVGRGMLAPDAVGVLREIRELLFDFVLKRSLVSSGTRLASSVFETRSFFMNPA